MATIEGQHFKASPGERIRTLGAGDTLRNCVIETTQDCIGNRNDGGLQIAVGSIDNPDAEVLIEHCVFDCGNAGHTALFVHRLCQANVTVRECAFYGWGSDCLYAETATPRGAGGTVNVENCLFVDNNVCHLRISNGSAKNCVMYNTGNVPGVCDDHSLVNSRAYWISYDSNQQVNMKNMHIDVNPENTNGNASAINIASDHSASDVLIEDSHINGPIVDDNNHATLRNTQTGGSPTHDAPAGVPMSYDEALNGTSSAPGIGGGGGSFTSVDEATTGGQESMTFRPEE